MMAVAVEVTRVDNVNFGIYVYVNTIYRPEKQIFHEK